MKALVTGGAGFIGSNLVDKLINEGLEVIVVDNLSTGSSSNLNPTAKFYEGDITDTTLGELFEYEKPQLVFHHAAQIDVQKSLKDPLLDARVNILGTINVLDSCVRYGVQKLVYASSAAVYGEPVYLGIDEKHPVDPMSCYGISKYTPEHYIKVYRQIYGLDYTILRYANVYGPRQAFKGEGGVVAVFLNMLLAGERPVIHGDGNQTRDFIFVGDIVEANYAAVSNGSGRTLNIGSGTNISVNELYKTIGNLLEIEFPPIYGPARKGDIRDSYFNAAAVREQLDWKPRFSLEEGLRKAINALTAKGENNG